MQTNSSIQQDDYKRESNSSGGQKLVINEEIYQRPPREKRKSEITSLSNFGNYKLSTLKQIAKLKSRINVNGLEPSKTCNDEIRRPNYKETLFRPPSMDHPKSRGYKIQTILERPTTTLAPIQTSLTKIDEFPKNQA